MKTYLVIMRGGTRAGKSVLSTQIGAWPNWTRIEMDAYKRQKYGTPWMCNPDVDFPAVGKLAKAALRRDQSVVVEESLSIKRMSLRWCAGRVSSWIRETSFTCGWSFRWSKPSRASQSQNFLSNGCEPSMHATRIDGSHRMN
jgi:hypothetical protein